MQRFHFYDNKDATDQLMNKDFGFFHIIDEASRQAQDSRYIFDQLQQRSKGVFVKQVSTHEFTVAHYTGKLAYDASEISEKNRDFLPPEMIETLRQANVTIVKELFTNQLTRSGNLTIVVDPPKGVEKPKSKWGRLMQETGKVRVCVRLSLLQT